MDKDTECQNCGFEFNFEENIDGCCPKCGSNKLNRKVFLFDEISTHELLKFAKNDKNFSKKKNPRQEIVIGEEFFKKEGKWVKKERIIDKDSNKYKELIINPETDEVIHYCEEPLSEHRDHGSAKKYWSSKDKREGFEIKGFIDSCRNIHNKLFTVVEENKENPDYIVKDTQNNLYGVELTSVYSDDRSVPDLHVKESNGEITYRKEAIKNYFSRILKVIDKKVSKAKVDYNKSNPLLLGIYVNEYISIYIYYEDWIEFIKEHEDFFKKAFPFQEILLWPLQNSGSLSVEIKNDNIRLSCFKGF